MCASSHISNKPDVFAHHVTYSSTCLGCSYILVICAKVLGRIAFLTSKGSDMMVLEKKGVPEEHVHIVQDMFRSSRRQVVTQKAETEYFQI